MTATIHRACQHQAAYSETGRVIGGHRELRCSDCMATFLSTATFGVGHVENCHRSLVLVHFRDKVRAWKVDQ